MTTHRRMIDNLCRQVLDEGQAVTHREDLLAAEVRRLQGEVADLQLKVSRVEGLLEDDDDPYVHVHAIDQNQGEPDCARCWSLDIRYALTGLDQ